MGASKSTWMGVSIGSPRAQVAVKSWFAMMVDDDDVVKEAEVLCDNETDQEKKVRIVIEDRAGNTFRLVRSLGARRYTITRTVIAKATAASVAGVEQGFALPSAKEQP